METKLVPSQFKLEQVEKSILAVLANEDGTHSMSAVIRRLIREEAKRRNLQTNEVKRYEPA